MNNTNPFHVPRIRVDPANRSFRKILRVGVSAADTWTMGPDGPYQSPQSPATTSSLQIEEALLHLLELGFIKIDEDRLAELEWIPLSRAD